MTDVGGEAPRITLVDVAKQAGVSPAAASLALRGKPGVADTTRRRVLDVASDLGYRARDTSASNGSLSVGLVVKASPLDSGTTNPFYSPIVAGITAACASAGIDLRLAHMPVDEHFNPVEIPSLVADDTADGFLVLGAFLTQQSADVFAGRPIVLVDGYATDATRFVNIVSDNVGGTSAATQRLIDAGHRNIALAGTTHDAFPSIRERRQGYTAAMRAAGLEPNYVDGHHFDPDAAAVVAADAYEAAGDLTAIVAANDTVAIAIIAELAERGVSFPRDASIVGFDDIEAASMIRPRLDTVAVDKAAMGRIAISMLRHRIANPTDAAFTVTQRSSLVVRESVSAPRS